MRHVPRLALVVVAALIVVAWAQQPAPGLYGYDGHFHIKYSELLRERLAAGEGLIREFPWWQETFFKDHFADKDFLYHVLLMPFASGDLERSGKTASIVFAVALYAALFASLAWLRAPGPAGWTLAVMLSSTTLLYRAGLLRSHVPAIALAMLGAAAVLTERPVWTAALSAAYALTHIAWHLIPGIALLYDSVRSVRERRPRFGITAASLAGTACAVLLSPYFPENLKLWWVQNVGVLTMAWSPGAPDLGLGLEVLPSRPALLLYYNIGPALFTALGLILLPGVRRDPASVTLAMITAGFLAMSLMSRRFVEFWAPMSVLFAGAAASGSRLWERHAGRPRARAAAVVLFGLLGLLNLHETRRIVGDDPGRVFDACASWLRDEVPDGEKIFTTDWDEFPELFFVAPRQRYLVGLDPTFMYATDPERWRLWREVAQARLADLRDPIAETFGCRYVFADGGYERFIERADQDPLFRLETHTPDCAVYEMGDPDEAGALHVGSWRVEGREGSLEAGPRDFIDVEKLEGDPGPCAQLHGTLESATAGQALFTLGTDDAIRVDLNGARVFDSAAARAPTIDEVLEGRSQGRGVNVRSFGGSLTAGYNDVSVHICRTGQVWGFHLWGASKP
ncbi:MAG TPA: hypothetical protein VGK94_11135 [Candidatus Polarisedimenticolia bacterium]